jgi:hypothetical protein
MGHGRISEIYYGICMAHKNKRGQRKPLGRFTLPLVLAAGGALPLSCTTINNTPYHVQEAGDTSHPLRQEDVNAEYNRLYNVISHAKKEAEVQGKTLTILIGEHHVSSLSYLHKILLCDIASRLGISQMILEQPPNSGLDLYAELAKNFRGNYLTSLDKSVEDNKSNNTPDEILRSLEPVLNHKKARPLLSLIAASLNAAGQGDKLGYRTMDVNWQPDCDIEFCDALGYKIHKGDPERYDAEGNPRQRTDPVVEDAMSASIQSVREHSVAVYGSAHLPEIMSELQQDKGKKILTYDVDNVNVIPMDHNDPIAQRSIIVEALGKYGFIEPLVINGAPPGYKAATYMVLTASLNHRIAHHEIDSETGELLQNGLQLINRDLNRKFGSWIVEGRAR